jgi:hypothetical protein
MNTARKPRPKPISWEVFRKIKHGDVLLTGEGKRPRLVLTGPGDYDASFRVKTDSPTSKAYVQVPIHARSWTNRAYTLLGFQELLHGYGPAWVYTPSSARALCGIERDTLKRLGFDWARELLRELAEVEHFESIGLEKFTAQSKRWLRRFAERAAGKAAGKGRIS